MIRKHGSLMIAMLLVAFVATACIIRTRRPPGQTAQPVYVEKHKPVKHKDQGKHKGHGDHDHD